MKIVNPATPIDESSIAIGSATCPNSSKTKPVDRKDSIAIASFVPPSSVMIRFSDGLEGTWTFRHLGLDMSNMDSATLEASSAGTTVEVKSKLGETVQLDASALRVLADPIYAAELDARLDKLANQIGL